MLSTALSNVRHDSSWQARFGKAMGVSGASFVNLDSNIHSLSAANSPLRALIKRVVGSQKTPCFAVSHVTTADQCREPSPIETLVTHRFAHSQ